MNARTTKLLGLSGSLREASFNTALLRTAVDLLPEGVTLDVRTPHGIPLYDGDLESADGLPPAVTDLKEAIAAADGLILATPEYNNSLPGVLKNAIDWASRPPADIKQVFGGRPVAIVGVATGGFGTILAQQAWLPVFRALGCQVWTGRLLVSRARSAFDADGRLTDEAVRGQLQQMLAGFAGFVAAAG